MPLAEGSGLFGKLRGWLRQHLGAGASSGTVLLWLLRGCFGVLVIGLALFIYNRLESQVGYVEAALTGALIVALGLFVVVIDVSVRNKQITTISAVYFGLLLGMLLGQLFSAALKPYVDDWIRDNVLRETIRLLITVFCCYVSISVLLQTKDEFRFIIPYVEFSK